MRPLHLILRVMSVGTLFYFMTGSHLSSTTSASTLKWERWPDLPDPVGLKGMYAGVHHGHLLLAGGSNFPVPRAQGGQKTFARVLFSRPVAMGVEGSWCVFENALPVALAEGASVTTEHGVVGLGGAGAVGAVSSAFVLSWKNGEPGPCQKLPNLPEPSATPAAVYWRGHVYVAGGENRGVGQARFLRLDLAAALARPDHVTWEELPTWPGPARFGAVFAVLSVDGRDQFLLAGGRTKTTGPASQADYLADAHAFDPVARRWTTLAAMPHRALLATALRLDENRLAVMGGSDGHSLDRMAELGERYRIPDRIMIYDSRREAWHVDDGVMPVGVVGAAVAELERGWLVAGGEYSPSLRTAQVFHWELTGRMTKAAR